MEKLLVGLDIGTDSVGWCATDENGKIIKKNGKSLWGYLGFDEASSAVDRRLARGARRRYNRRQERIKLLRMIFSNEINNTDPSFFYRLDNSFYKKEDLEKPFDYTLFNDKNYKDSDYYKDYPTIYHLRQKLLYSKEKEDIRLIYLAMHHMIKYRGNFLSDVSEFKPMAKEDLDVLFIQLNDNISQNSDDELEISNIEYNEEVYKKLKDIVVHNSGISLLKEKFNEELNKNKNKYLKDVIIPLMVGAEVAVNKLGLKNIEDHNKEKLCAKSESFETLINALLDDNSNQENLINIFIACKDIYTSFAIGKLLGNNKYLCDAMVERYNEHKEQLKLLKKYVKENIPEKYNEIFRNIEKGDVNYAHYIGSNITNNEQKRVSHVSQEDFYKYLKKELNLNDKTENEYLKSVLKDINNGEYLLRQNGTDNGVFPYQLNKMEMKQILETQSQFYPFLKEKDEDGTNLEKIISILEYKIPYYVGPLIPVKEGDKRSSFSWIERSKEKIYPWNYKRVINLDETAKNFIYRMLNKCTYLPSCYCLPKNSIIFSYYNVLQVLNKTNINGKSISYELKVDIINNLFKKTRKVTKKTLLNYLKSKEGTNDIELATSNDKELKEFNCDMASYYDFVKVFGSEEYVDSHIDIIENIIRDIVVFEDKSILVKRLDSEYGIKDERIIKAIKGLTYSKYASISKELLTDIKCNIINDDTGEVIKKSILQIMEEGNQNLQEVLFDENYKFKELITQYNKEKTPGSDFKTIEDYVGEISYLSPGMKRPLIQAYKICEEIEKITGRRIDEYYVECTRTNKEKKKESVSRKQNLLNIYDEAIKKATEATKDELKTLRKKIDEIDVGKFQSDKYYFYFTQMGRCMYSGEKLDFESLNDTSLYDIDHIYPQSLIKDDSLTNRVLVKQSCNRYKSDIYPIPQNELFNGNYKKAYAFYKKLLDCGFINENKYKRLTALELKESELESFVNRQLVYTNQAVKGLINAIMAMKSTNEFEPKIVYSKGENVSDFRKNFDIVKSREVNNFHHAHDAYLNIIVGRAIDNYFSKFKNKSAGEWLKEMHDKGYTTNVAKVLQQNEKKKKENIYDGKYLVWDYENSVKEIAKNIYERFDIFSTERTYVGNTLFGKVTIYPASEGANISIKEKGPLSDPNKYGGLKQYAFGSYSLIKSNDDYIIEAIPTAKKNKLNEYLDTIYSNYEIIIPCLKIGTILEAENRKSSITGRNDKNTFYIKNKIERIFGKEEIHIIKKIEKLVDKLKGDTKNISTIEEINNKGFIYDGTEIVVAPAGNKNAKEIRLSNEECIKVYDYFKDMLGKEIYSYSQSLAIQKLMIDNKEVFNNLSIIEKSLLIIELLKYLKCNSKLPSDLTLIKGSSNAGKLTISKKLKNCKIIYESITGFYRKVAFEVK